MTNQQLLTFIKEAKHRGYDTYQIRTALLHEGWSEDEVDHAFETLEPRGKNRISIYLDDKILAVIEKRAKRNLLTLPEQVEDIVRRSAVNAKHTTIKPEKLDDLLVSIFSRKSKKR